MMPIEIQERILPATGSAMHTTKLCDSYASSYASVSYRPQEDKYLRWGNHRPYFSSLIFFHKGKSRSIVRTNEV